MRVLTRGTLTMGLTGLLLAAILGLSSPVSAQVRQAEVAGTVTDESGAVLPGVTVTATHVETRQVRTTVTDSGGRYLLTALPVGVYEVRAELPGFRAMLFSDYRLQIGDSARLDVRMAVATLEEAITVSGAAPLVDTTKSDLSGRIDQIQMEELPLAGRNWLNFATLAPGVKSDGRGGQPTAGVGGVQQSKVYVDGGQIQNLSTVAIDLEISKEIVGEFEVITNRFDAVMGRAGTAVVNAVTKSGTDTLRGLGFLAFRDDALNQTDFFTGRVEPFRSIQYGLTFGGPIRRGQTHYFGSYERQEEPRTLSANTGIAILDQPIDSTDTSNLFFGRVDHSLTRNHRVTFRYNRFDRLVPYQNVGGAVSVSSSVTSDFQTDRFNLGLSSVLGQRFVNQFALTYLSSERLFNRFSGPPDPQTFGLAPSHDNRHTFPSVTIGAIPNVGNEYPSFWHLRNDASFVFEWRGQHRLKFGGEWNHQYISGTFANNNNGTFFYNQDPPNLATCCAGGDQSTWDKSQFPVPARYTQGLGDFFYDAPNDIYAAYIQNDWTVHPRLVLNLGVRYDLETGSLDHTTAGTIVQPRKNDVNNLQPRLGFAWDVAGTGATVVRGGGGIYYDQVHLNLTFNQRRAATLRQVSVTTFNPTGDPAFAADPLRGQGYDDFVRGAGAVNMTRFADNAEQPHVYTGSIGVARQLTSNLALSVDYVAQGSDSFLVARDTNLFCCLPGGGALPIQSGTFPELGGFIQGAGRPDPRFNAITTYFFDGRSRYHGLQVALNKRMSHSYQFGVSYLWSKNMDTGAPNNAFNPADDYGRAATDQPHRLVANVVSRVPGGINLAGVLHTASGLARGAGTGGIDINGDGGAGGDRPTCGRDPRFSAACALLGVATGDRIPRNPWRSDGIFRVDLRLSRPLVFRGVRVDPSVEVFNLLNRENYDPVAYNTNLVSAQFGNPGRSSALPYQARQAQLAFRVEF
ncbi:TonB-dependent receptor [soil metagenome]